ncbi:MAG TPA: class I SAM-dependent methyltransferase [Blastocatellia bacterium]|nr:class I SAM-dependent methyltransferase [Blastocatellia bacterium]
MPLDSRKTWDACGEAFDRFTTAKDSYSDNIERPAIERLLGEVKDARVLDLGCGSATYSTWLAARGAIVTGIDLSPKMLALAKSRANEQNLQLDLCIADAGDPLPFSDSAFDLIFTSTTLHFVKDIARLMREATRVMKPAAWLIASVLHPISTARFPLADSELARNARWESRHEWGANYFGKPQRTIETPWLGFGAVSSEGRTITCYHHTTADYFNAIQSAGLAITELCEPAPQLSFAEKNVARYDEAMSVPVYLIMKAVKA